MSRRDRMKARKPKTKIVPLPGHVKGEEDESFEVRQIKATEFDDLVAAHPGREGKDEAWNIETFRPALLVACVVTPDGEEPITAQDWMDGPQDGWINAGELMILFNACVEVNDRSPAAVTGKG